MKGALIVAALFLSGCCMYNGKAVSRADAEEMKRLGLNVQCIPRSP